MHDSIADLIVVWQLALVALLAFRAARARSLLAAVLALEALSLVVVALAVVLAVSRDEAGFMTVALVLALLGFVQTVAVAQFAVRERDDG